MKMIIFTVYYNRAEQADESVRSLLKAAPSDAKVVLVDDGSTDETLHKLKAYKSDHRVVVESGVNSGFTNALVNAIEKHANPEMYKYMAVYGSGDICSPDKYSKQVAYLEENQDIVALGTGHTVRSYSTGYVTLEEDGFYEASKQTLSERVPFTQGTVVYRLDAYMSTGGYNRVFKFSQDKDLYVRLIDEGRIVRYPEALYTQYLFSDGASSNPNKKREQLKYHYLIDMHYNDPEKFEEVSKKIMQSNIHSVIGDEHFVDKYKAAQKRLIYQGEYLLASQWSDILIGLDNKSSQKRLKMILLALEKSTFMKFMMSKAFYTARKLLR